MKAKRLVSCVCALAISSASLATGFVSAADAEITLKGAQIEKKAGESFELNIDLSEMTGNATKGFSGCEFAITYDPAKITGVTVEEGAAFSSTGATGEELNKAPTIGDEVTMVHDQNGKYNCFDYNTVASEGKDTTIAVLWCTGLESSDYWVKKPGTLLTVKGTVAADAKAGEKIPVNIVPISRDGNDKMVFGYIDGDTDKAYTSTVAQQGLITVVTDGPGQDLQPTLWGDLNVNESVTAADLVAMVQFVLDPEIANLSDQGIVNGNLYQADGNTDLTSDEILDANDLFLLKKLILEDLDQTDFPYMKKLS